MDMFFAVVYGLLILVFLVLLLFCIKEKCRKKAALKKFVEKSEEFNEDLTRFREGLEKPETLMEKFQEMDSALDELYPKKRKK